MRALPIVHLGPPPVLHARASHWYARVPIDLRAAVPPQPEDDDGYSELDGLLNGEETPPGVPPAVSPDAAAKPSPPPLDEEELLSPEQNSPISATTTTATPALHHPLPQAILCAAGYLVHVWVLSRHSLRLPGGLPTVGWDTLAGLLVIAAAMRQRIANGRPALPTWLSRGNAPSDADKEPEEALVADLSGKVSTGKERLQLLISCGGLLVAPLLFSFTKPVVDVLLSLIVLAGAPLNSVRMASARLIVEQTLLYVLLGKVIAARHPKFWSRQWVRWSWRGPWLLPVLGGYAASLSLFNLVEPLNQALLPGLAYLPEGIVAKLANPADRDARSLLLASVAPCVGAPLFEELQSRAFILQALRAVMPLRNALLAQGLLFGAQHLQLGLVLPLSVTGFAWGVMYVYSGNLLVPVLIHALWNARIFLGSYLGV